MATPHFDPPPSILVFLSLSLRDAIVDPRAGAIIDDVVEIDEEPILATASD